MTTQSGTTSADTSPRGELRRVKRIGCVSYLNSRPLIEGLDELDEPSVTFDVPSRLLEDLETGQVDVALCPVIDYHRSKIPLLIVPAGGIGCRGPTLTVRLFSRVPIAQITHIFADSDSHTSVALLRVLLSRGHGLTPTIVPFHAGERVAEGKLIDAPQAMLLIGDKVVTACPDESHYPHQVDLGEAWHQMTGMPFVFATWLARQDVDLGDLPQVLRRQRERNAMRIDEIVERHAVARGWPKELARKYLGSLLRYPVGEEELRAIEQFGVWAAEVGAIPFARPLIVARG